jgi:hypothetical protein
MKAGLERQFAYRTIIDRCRRLHHSILEMSYIGVLPHAVYRQPFCRGGHVHHGARGRTNSLGTHGMDSRVRRLLALSSHPGAAILDTSFPARASAFALRRESGKPRFAQGGFPRSSPGKNRSWFSGHFDFGRPGLTNQFAIPAQV